MHHSLQPTKFGTNSDTSTEAVTLVNASVQTEESVTGSNENGSIVGFRKSWFLSSREEAELCLGLRVSSDKTQTPQVIKLFGSIIFFPTSVYVPIQFYTNSTLHICVWKKISKLCMNKLFHKYFSLKNKTKFFQPEILMVAELTFISKGIIMFVCIA